MKATIFRPIQLVLLGSLALIVLSILISSWLTWREHEMLVTARSDLQQALALQQAHDVVEQQLVAAVRGRRAPSGEEIARQIGELIELYPASDRETVRRLQELRRHVLRSGASGPIGRSLALLDEIGESEDRHQAALLSSIERAAGRQLRYELAGSLAILAIGALVLPVTRRRVIQPLESFGRQISRLSKGDFTLPVEEDFDELTLSPGRSLIELARRLQKLEREHKEREASLEEAVHEATEALLEQQISLARSERLAATGELAASVAHELRNPLAGIQMSLSNLRREQQDPKRVERLDLVVDEVVRLGRLVNELVDLAHHDPEPLRVVDLADLVDPLLALSRYRLSPKIRLESRVQAGLCCRVARDRLRQALLNLVLNSAEAMGESGGFICVEARSEGDDVRIRVCDDGPGFPRELLDGGIRPFYSTRALGGGLGLAMVRRFVCELEGQIQLSNRPADEAPHGACVTLLLPSVLHHG